MECKHVMVGATAVGGGYVRATCDGPASNRTVANADGMYKRTSASGRASSTSHPLHQH